MASDILTRGIASIFCKLRSTNAAPYSATWLLTLIAGVSCAGLVPMARAADLAIKAPMQAVISPLNWTGPYVGANVGGGWGNRSVDFAPNDTSVLPANVPPSTSFNTSGALGGVQAGYNWQFNRNWLVGIEADFDVSGVKGSAVSSNTLLGGALLTAPVDERINWFGTLRARWGFLPTDNLVAYVTGGLAYGQVVRTGSYSLPINSFGFNNTNSFACAASPCFTGSSSEIDVGWALGGGIEYAFRNNFTLKVEYLRVSLDAGSTTETARSILLLGTAPSSLNANFSRASFNVARIGLDYRF